VRVLFVCLGNICRSPTVEAVCRELLRREAPELPVGFDSAGTADYHLGDPPDRRSQEAALRRGFDLSSHRGRQVGIADFEAFDLLLAMDGANLRALRRQAPAAAHDRVRLFLDFDPGARVREVPDPYYGGPEVFEEVLDLAERGGRALILHLSNLGRRTLAPVE
jgi:protein-tyrosine phosphatase